MIIILAIHLSQNSGHTKTLLWIIYNCAISRHKSKHKFGITNKSLLFRVLLESFEMVHTFYLRPSYTSRISLISALECTPRISIKVFSSVPKPLMALWSSLAWYSTGGVIKAIITSSKLPLSSLFSSLIRSWKNTYSTIKRILKHASLHCRNV